MMKKYRILIKGDGGEFVLGKIPGEAYSFWSARPSDELILHVCDPESAGPEISDQHVLNKWFDIDEFAHEYGIENMESLVVEDSSGELAAQFEREELLESTPIEYAEVVGRQSMNGYDGPLFFARSFEKGTCVFEIETSERFDIGKLQFTQIDLWDHELLSKLTYDGVELTMVDDFGRDFADVTAQISSPQYDD